MLTDLEIVNNALGRLNCERIASLSDSNKRAKIANDYLELSRGVTLEMSPWGFATQRVSLSSVGTPAFEWTHQFEKPDDLIHIIKEYNGEDYKEEGEYILANSETLLLVYVGEIDEDTKRSPSFDKAWYLVLASMMAYSLTQNMGLKDQIMAEAELIVGRAMSLNSSNSTPVSYEIDTFTNSRL